MTTLALLVVLLLPEQADRPRAGMTLAEFERLWPPQNVRPIRTARQVINLRYLEQRVYGEPLNCRMEIDFPSGKAPILRWVKPLTGADR